MIVVTVFSASSFSLIRSAWVKKSTDRVDSGRNRAESGSLKFSFEIKSEEI
jgi:hypothetical protein